MDTIQNATKRDLLLAKLAQAKQRKRESADAMIKELKERYEQRTGQKANYVFVL